MGLKSKPEVIREETGVHLVSSCLVFYWEPSVMAGAE